MVRMWAAGVLATVVLAGCASNPAEDQAVQAPVSQQTAVGDARQRAKAHAELGQLYLGEGQLNVALDEANIAIEADSTYPLGYNLLALVQMYLKENRAAEESFNRALRLAPGDPEINNNFGWFLCQTGRPQQSIAYFQVASKSPLYSTPTKPLTNAGICSVNMRDDKAAESYLVSAVRADSLNADAHYLLADIYFRAGRTAEARQRINEVHRLGDPTAETLWLAVRIERKLGDREMEARHASQIRRKFQNTPEYEKLMRGQYE